MPKYRTVIIIGHSRGILYKVMLGNRLQPRKSSTDNRPMMPGNSLGISDYVGPSLKNLSEESINAAESDDYDRNAFHQLGALVPYKGDYRKVGIDKGMNDSEDWEDTGFAVVSEVTTRLARWVWLFFDFWPFDPASTDRYHLQDDDYWGWLPNHK